MTSKSEYFAARGFGRYGMRTARAASGSCPRTPNGASRLRDGIDFGRVSQACRGQPKFWGSKGSEDSVLQRGP